MTTQTKCFGRRMALTAIVLLLPACTARPLDPDCGQTCESFTKLPGVGECQAGECTPTFFECFDKVEFDTCTAMCESVGSACAEQACAGGTYMIHESLEYCLDPSKEGALVDRPCEEPIDWQAYTIAQCCCEQP